MQHLGRNLLQLEHVPIRVSRLVLRSSLGVCVLTTGLSRSRTQDGLQELLLGLLCNLALDDKDQSVRARIVRGGAMTASIMLLHSDNVAVQEAAASALEGITTPGCVQ